MKIDAQSDDRAPADRIYPEIGCDPHHMRTRVLDPSVDGCERGKATQQRVLDEI